MPVASFTSLLQEESIDSVSGRIIRALSERGSLSAAQIARSTGLARSTVSTAVAALRKSGLVMDADSPDGPVSRQIGRPGTALRLNPEAGTCIGVHIGLDELRVVVADVSHSIISEQNIPMVRNYSPAEAALQLQQFIASTYAEHGLRHAGLLGIGVSVSAPVSPNGTVHRSSIVPSWAGVNVVEVFGAALGTSILVNNESNCSAIAEYMWGAAQGEEDFVLFKMVNVGIGGSIVVKGQVRSGVAGGAGEFGHISIDPEGELCRCGNRGCLELKLGFAAALSDLSRVHGQRVTMDQAVDLALAGDVGAARLISDQGELAGLALAMIGNVLNPPMFLISTALVRSGPILMDPLCAAFEKHSLLKTHELDEALRTRIVPGALFANDVVLGAVGLVLRHHGRIS